MAATSAPDCEDGGDVLEEDAMRGVLIGMCVLYAFGVVATTGAHAVMLWDHGWPASTVAFPAFQQGLGWPVDLIKLLAQIRI